jgi:hypothetical protein
MIDTCNRPDICGWHDEDGGESFVVKDPKRFESEIIPQFFKHSKFTSFVRQRKSISSSTLVGCFVSVRLLVVWNYLDGGPWGWSHKRIYLPDKQACHGCCIDRSSKPWFMNLTWRSITFGDLSSLK